MVTNFSNTSSVDEQTSNCFFKLIFGNGNNTEREDSPPQGRILFLCLRNVRRGRTHFTAHLRYSFPSDCFVWRLLYSFFFSSGFSYKVCWQGPTSIQISVKSWVFSLRLRVTLPHTFTNWALEQWTPLACLVFKTPGLRAHKYSTVRPATEQLWRP